MNMEEENQRLRCHNETLKKTETEFTAFQQQTDQSEKEFQLKIELYTKQLDESKERLSQSKHEQSTLMKKIESMQSNFQQEKEKVLSRNQCLCLRSLNCYYTN